MMQICVENIYDIVDVDIGQCYTTNNNLSSYMTSQYRNNISV